ncbi:MAG: hypothetical protein IKK63_09435 [Clostridia bacterium]|nr:hypothetical protein [Clostridia bacterium]MBR3817987.1 hypothetical protein [Clostridia bacterium]
MNEITKALRIADTAIRTVRIIDVVKKGIISVSAVLCLLFAFRFFRK